MLDVDVIAPVLIHMCAQHRWLFQKRKSLLTQAGRASQQASPSPQCSQELVRSAVQSYRLVFHRSVRQRALREQDIQVYKEAFPNLFQDGMSCLATIRSQSRARFGAYMTELGGSQKHVVHFLLHGSMDCDARKLPKVEDMVAGTSLLGEANQEEEPSETDAVERRRARLSKPAPIRVRSPTAQSNYFKNLAHTIREQPNSTRSAVVRALRILEDIKNDDRRHWRGRDWYMAQNLSAAMPEIQEPQGKRQRKGEGSSPGPSTRAPSSWKFCASSHRWWRRW